tara:strand:- start:6948 stop:7640 length:693 start_codon:yes stop_codon:yes gene_type:complete
MLLFLDKKSKIYLYIFIFLFLSTINNNQILGISNAYLIKNIELNNIEINLKKILENKLQTIKGENIFFIKKNEINNKFKDINFLDNITVKKKFPSTLIVNVKKTNLLAITVINNRKYYLGSNGYLIDYDIINSKKNLPNYFGAYNKKEFLKLLDLINKINFKIENIKSFYFFPSGRWDLETINGIKIKLANNNLEKNLILSKKIIKKENKNNYVIDLRVKDQVVIYYDEG